MTTTDVAHSTRCELACEWLRISGSLRLKVKGWSMLPSIWPDDILIISRLDAREFLPGDIALYQRSGRLFIHRVVAMSESDAAPVVTVQGDGLAHADPSLFTRDLVGKVDCILRDGRRIEPAQTLGKWQRAVAGLVRRSATAARLVVGVRQLFLNLQSATQED
jgi:hypothetical protein